MLGTTRTTVTNAASALKKEGLILYIRAEMQILDPQGLEKKACECYRVVKVHLDSSSQFDSSIVA